MTLTDTARTIFQRAMADCNVERAMARHVSARNAHLNIDDEDIDLGSMHRIRIASVGKAAHTMLPALWKYLPHEDVAGVLIAPQPPSPMPDGFQYFCGGHPVPNEASFAGARAALATARAAAEDPEHTLCLFLISGGASAMMELPLDPAITVAEAAAFHRALVASGAPIAEMNCVRKHFSAVKGGRLVLAAGSALCRSLLVSDVPASRRDSLGSGPTLPDPSTVKECREILARHRLLPQFPASVRRFFESDTLPETPKPGQLSARACTLLDSQDLALAAARQAEALGWTAVLDNTCDEWEYREATSYLLDRLRALRREYRQVCLISAGELSVPLPASGIGMGGRNQHFALYAATLLSPGDGAVGVLSAGSDGIDGNSPAAGAVVEAGITKDPILRELAMRALSSFDSHNFLSAQQATLTTGPTGNNVRDLRILLAEPNQ